MNIIIQHPFIYSQFQYCMFHYLHAHWAVLPWNVFNTLKHRNNTRKGSIKLITSDVGGQNQVQSVTITLWFPRRSWAKHRLHFSQWKYFSLGPILWGSQQQPVTDRDHMSRTKNVFSVFTGKTPARTTVHHQLTIPSTPTRQVWKHGLLGVYDPSPAYSTGLTVILLLVLVKQVANVTVILPELHMALPACLLCLKQWYFTFILSFF